MINPWLRTLALALERVVDTPVAATLFLKSITYIVINQPVQPGVFITVLEFAKRTKVWDEEM